MTDIIEVIRDVSTVQVIEGDLSTVEVIKGDAPAVEVIEGSGSTVELIKGGEFTVEVIESGQTGPPGPPGPPGPASPGFVYTQVAPSAVWNVVHNLGFYPSVTVVDSGGSEVLVDEHYNDQNSITLVFASATSGKAYLN